MAPATPAETSATGASTAGTAAEALRPQQARTTPGAQLARRFLLPPAALLGIVILWQALIWITNVPPYIIPTPASVARALVVQRGMLWINTVPTILESLGGFLLGNVLAIAVAVSFVYNRTLERTFYPLAVAIRTVPIVAISPILVLLLGNGYAPKIAIAALITFFPTLVNMVQGLQAADAQALELMHVMSASKSETFRFVRWPSSLPYLFAALRVASTSSVLGAIVAEWIGSNKGLGYLIVLTTFDFRTALLYASMVIASAIALAFFLLISILEWAVVRWER
jgi:NitT/TauT family transport system permease protein